MSYQPADQPVAEQIRKQILEQLDAVIYEEDGDNVSRTGNGDTLHTEEELERAATIDQMQLLVFVISRRFIAETASVQMQDFMRAKEQHVLFLPVSIEDGIGEAFNRICGSYQLLSFGDESFTEDLHLFLQSHIEDAGVHIWDENRGVYVEYSRRKLVESCFSGRIFLSYRKKDCVQALNLMRRIHHHPGFENLGIWFDHFLTQGEEYNAEIEENLKKSDIVLLLVTPSLLEEGNYVMEREYPKAVEEGKTILPVMMEYTDLLELCQKFSGLPACINEDLPGELEHHISRLAERLGFSNRELSANDLEILGTAYLQGTYVEKDSELGMHLMQESADRGDPEAANYLADMAFQGVYAEKDIDLTIAYLEKAAASYEAICKEEDRSLRQANPLENGVHYGKVLERLYQLYFAEEDFVRASRTLQRTLVLTRRNASLGGYSASSNEGLVYMHMGELAFEQERYPEAEDYYVKAQPILAGFEQQGSDYGIYYYGELTHHLRKLYHKILVDTGNRELLKPAIQYGYDAMKHFLEMARRKPTGYERVQEEAFALAGFAALCEQVDMVSARKLHLEIAEVYREIIEKEPNYAAYKGLAVEYFGLGDIGGAQNTPEEKRRYLLAARDLFLQLMENEPGDEEASRYLEMVEKRLIF